MLSDSCCFCHTFGTFLDIRTGVELRRFASGSWVAVACPELRLFATPLEPLWIFAFGTLLDIWTGVELRRFASNSWVAVACPELRPFVTPLERLWIFGFGTFSGFLNYSAILSWCCIAALCAWFLSCSCLSWTLTVCHTLSDFWLLPVFVWLFDFWLNWILSLSTGLPIPWRSVICLLTLWLFWPLLFLATMMRFLLDFENEFTFYSPHFFHPLSWLWQKLLLKIPFHPLSWLWRNLFLLRALLPSTELALTEVAA